jgi:hypothetical protein
MFLRPYFLLITLLLGGCNIPGLEPDPRIAKREEDAKAIGAGCRHGLRSIEDCYSLNESASKSAIFTGWKDMDQYMRENKIEGVRAVARSTEPVETIVEGKTSRVTPDKGSETKPVAAKPATAPSGN